MKCFGIVLLAMLISLQHLQSQSMDTSTLSGSVSDIFDQPLVGATVFIEESGKGTSTDEDGNFSIDLSSGKFTLKISNIGYVTSEMKIVIPYNKFLNIKLEVDTELLQEIQVTGEAKDYNVSSTFMGITRLTMNSIKALPGLLGEVDVIRALQMTSGVSTVGEGATGFNVRGGNIDQNLILLDDAPIFNSSHLMGFVSIFNVDALRDLTFIRGGLPAQYGGRASSVLDLKVKDPDMNKFKMQGGIGLISSRFSFELPIIKDRVAIMLGARGSIVDYLLDLLPQSSAKNTRAGFYDVTGKIKIKLTHKDYLHLSGYNSQDYFKIPSDSLVNLEINATSSIFKWLTSTASLKWNHNFSDQLFSNLSLIWSDYQPNVEFPDENFASKLSTQISYKGVKLDMVFQNEKHNTVIGAQGSHYKIQPGLLQPTTTASQIKGFELQGDQALELAGYINEEYKINGWLNITGGIRMSRFTDLGPKTVYVYEANAPKDPTTIVDSLKYDSGQGIKSYFAMEPRASARISLSPNTSFKLSAGRMAQFIHQITNTTAALPTARWKTSDQYLKPLFSNQYSAGIFQNLKNNTFEMSIEGFYKTIKNMGDYRSGINLIQYDYPEAAILQGEGIARGIELGIQKKKGKLKGWMNYTYSQSTLKVQSPYFEDRFFSNRFNPTNYDRPHVANLSLQYRWTNITSVSLNFVYQSGRPTTYADDKYFVSGTYVPNFASRNQHRIPDYHRMDLSFTFEGKNNADKRWKSDWVLGIYNLYGRKNAYSVFTRTKSNSVNNAGTVLVSNKVAIYKLAILGAVIPSLTYNFRFE